MDDFTHARDGVIDEDQAAKQAIATESGAYAEKDARKYDESVSLTALGSRRRFGLSVEVISGEVQKRE